MHTRRRGRRGPVHGSDTAGDKLGADRPRRHVHSRPYYDRAKFFERVYADGHGGTGDSAP